MSLNTLFFKNVDRVISRILLIGPVIRLIQYLLDKWYKKNGEHKVTFYGAMNGWYYGDNAKHLFEYAIAIDIKDTIFWVTRNYALYSELKSKQKPVLYMYSVAYFRKLAKCRKAIYTDSLRDILTSPFITHKSLRTINLRHGRSVKRVRYARKNHKISNKEKIERNHETNLIKYCISTSKFISKLQEECLLLGNEKHIVTGYPRNDYLVKNAQNGERQFTHNSYYEIIYSPSWRHGREPVKFFPFDNFNLPNFDEYLVENGIRIWVRPHVGELFETSVKKFLRKIENCKNIKLLSHSICSDINSVLHEFDGMITDYSAIFHDFLLLDRPILFIPYDYSNFEHNNGFLYDYYKLLPGPAIKNQKQLKNEISTIKNSPNYFEEKRTFLKNLIHTYKDQKSCSRVHSLLQNNL